MADNQNYIGIAMGLDVSDLKAGLSEANKQIQLANSRFKAASSGMDDWTKSAEGLAAKIEQLDTVLKMQQSKLAGLKAEYAKVAKEQGENSEAARRLQVQINNQQAVVNRTEKEYKNYKTTLKGVEDGSIDLEKVTLKAGKAVEKTGKQAKEAGDGFTIAKGAVAGFIANGMTALVGACKDAITGIMGVADATREYRRTLATLDTAADDAGVNVDKMRDKFTDLMGVFNDEDSVTEGLNNLMAAGFDEKNIDAITEQLEGAALKFKDTLKFEGVSDGLQETLATGKAIGPFAELLERSGVNLEKFDEGLGKAKTSAEKQNYVLQELSKLGLADVSKNFREQNADMIAAEKANVEYQNSMAELGEVTEPIMTELRKGMTELLKAIVKLVSGGDLEKMKASISGAFDTFINDTLPKIINGIKWLIDNKEIVVGSISAMGAAFAVFKVAQLIDAVRKSLTLMTIATKIATAAQWLWNAAMTANPIGIIIMAIAALIAIIVALVKNWDSVKEAGAKAWDGIKNAWSAAKDFFANIWAKLKEGASNAWSGIKSVFSKVGSFFSDTFSKAWQKVKDIFSTGGQIFDGIKDGIVSAFKNIVNALIRGINKVVSVPFNALNKVLDKIRGVTIAKLQPFKNIVGEISVPQIPELEKGGVLKKGQIGLLEGKGAEAVVPLERNLGWIKKIAAQLAKSLDITGVKSRAAALAYGGASGGSMPSMSKSTVINAGMTVHYNGNLSRKQLKRLENDNYNSIRTRLKTEGAI